VITHWHVWDVANHRLLPGPQTENQWLPLQPVETQTQYIAAAMKMLRDAGLEPGGLTMCWSYPTEKEALLGQATLQAAERVCGLKYVMVFNEPGDRPQVIYRRGDGAMAVSLRPSVDDVYDHTFGKKTEADIQHDADGYITADGTAGRFVESIKKDGCLIFCTHAQTLYGNGTKSGWKVFQIAVERLHKHYGNHICWMTGLEICRHFCPAEQTTATTDTPRVLAASAHGAIAHINATTRNHSASAETVLIAENGTAKLPILISERAGTETKTRANELASYLERITGGKFEIKKGMQGSGIFVGTIQQFPTPSAADGLRVYDGYDGRDAYAIRTEGGCIKLLGATDPGASHAVSRFLESFGCRWFFPGSVWEVVPRRSKLTFNVNETDRPEVLGADFGYDLGQQYEKQDPDAGEATKNWFRKNRVPRGFKSAAGHCAHNVVSRFWKEFEAHPEYRALIKDEEGKLLRTGTGPETPKGQPLKLGSKSWGMWGQLCVSNRETVKLVTRYAQEWLDKNPDVDMVGVGPDDGGEWCLCPECAKLGNCGNQAFYLANEVAKTLQKSHPGKLAGLLAYNWHCDPPDFPLESNVYVELTTSLLLNTKYGFDRLREVWPRKVKYFGLYDYWAVYDWTRDALPSGRTGSTRYVADNVASNVRRGVACLRAECGNSWGPQGVGHYLAAHVLWNSSADLEAVKADFYDKAFGPASQAMKAYYDHVDMGNEPLVGPPFYRICLDDLETAERAAAGHPDVLARIAQLKQYNIYAYLLHKERDTALKPEVRKKWAFETLRWNYRIRNTYMTFWTFFAGMTSAQWAREFNEPTWNWYEMRERRDLIPYRDPSPITAEEVARRFQEMKADYGVAPKVTNVSFSKRLAAPMWPARKPSPDEPTEIVMHGAYTMALASLKGEPLRFSIRDGIMYPDNPPGAYVLSDMAGKEIARGEVPICEKTAERIELKVPAAGVYYFKFNDFGAGTAFTPAKDHRAAFVPEGPRGYTLLRSTWFYVPKGTAEIQFCVAYPGMKLGVCDPSGRWIESDGRPHVGPERELLSFKTGSYCVIPVPKGMDGAMWKLVLYQCSFHVRFFNIPTILSLTSDGPIVPEEVAKKDGLN
jgi:hypothetical protein